MSIDYFFFLVIVTNFPHFPNLISLISNFVDIIENVIYKLVNYYRDYQFIGIRMFIRINWFLLTQQSLANAGNNIRRSGRNKDENQCQSNCSLPRHFLDFLATNGISWSENLSHRRKIIGRWFQIGSQVGTSS